MQSIEKKQMKKPSDLSKKQQKILAALAIAVYIMVMLAVGVVIGIPILRFVSEPEQFRLWVDSHGIWGPILYVAFVFLQVVVALIPGEVFEIVGGYAFGTWMGTFLCLLGSTLGSVSVFALVRRYGVKLVQVFFSLDKLKALHFLKKSPKRIFLFWIIFMIPGTPKDLLCYYAGLTDMKWKTFILIASLGRIPAMITSTVGGDALGLQNYVFAIVILVIAVAISGIGLFIYNRICDKEEKEIETHKK
ncbi:MAG: TVP38/TMEM64 family protein [Lachnospiraceae bacterium]|nr:TVP38/TMEM64 family protein [Lachnospiraceae bacterium]